MNAALTASATISTRLPGTQGEIRQFHSHFFLHFSAKEIPFDGGAGACQTRIRKLWNFA